MEICHPKKKVLVLTLTENVHNCEGFEQLLSITGHAGEARDYIVDIQARRVTLTKEGEYLNIYKCHKL